MNVKIVKIPGRGRQSRQNSFALMNAWMENHGWKLMDYAEGAATAAFERAPDAPPLGWFDPTRWLPGPDWNRPRAWISGRRGSKRDVILIGAVCLVVAVAFMAVLSYSNSGPSSLGSGGGAVAGETWLYVNANSLNVRLSPVSGAQIVGVLYRNQKVLVNQTNEGWARLVQPEKGFVAEKFLKPHPVQ